MGSPMKHVGDETAIQTVTVTKDIVPFTEYMVRVIAKNKIGSSKQSRGDDVFRNGINSIIQFNKIILF